MSNGIGALSGINDLTVFLPTHRLSRNCYGRTNSEFTSATGRSAQTTRSRQGAAQKRNGSHRFAAEANSRAYN
jgi:hypothetical protein